MTARILLADTLQTYREEELAFLRALAQKLPPSCVVRAFHQDKSQHLMRITVDVRITPAMLVAGNLTQPDALASEYRDNIRRQAHHAWNLFINWQEPRAWPCPACGQSLALAYSATRRVPDKVCKACGWSSASAHQKRG
jgi:hypothetical protein